MKRGLMIFVGLFIALTLSAQGIEFYHGSFDNALQKAQTENKRIFVDVYTSWCGPCKMMAKKVFTNPEVGKYFNKRFVCLKLDAEKEKDHGFFKKYKAGSFPTVFWLDAKGELLDVHSGFVQPAEFLKLAKAAESSDFTKRLEAGKKRWESGERSAALVNEYVLELLAKVKPQSVTPMIMEYLNGLNDSQLLQKENYLLLRMFMRGVENDFVFDTMIKNAEVYQGYEKNYGFWVRMYRMAVRYGSAIREDQAKYSAFINTLKKKNSPLTDMYVKILDMENKLFEKDYEKGISQASAILAEYGEKHPYLCGQFMYTLIIADFFNVEKVSDELADEVILWAEKALKTVPCKENVMYLSVAHVRKGDYKKAWQILGGLPFFPEPMLSNAVYPRIDLPVFHRKYLK